MQASIPIPNIEIASSIPHGSHDIPHVHVLREFRLLLNEFDHFAALRIDQDLYVRGLFSVLLYHKGGRLRRHRLIGADVRLDVSP